MPTPSEKKPIFQRQRSYGTLNTKTDMANMMRNRDVSHLPPAQQSFFKKVDDAIAEATSAFDRRHQFKKI